ncbi:hypothetical protein GQ53DRAFT_621460, partial [Thozetella sp. PMI_491]
IRPEKCQRYAGILSPIGRTGYELIYWILFSFTLILLLLTSHSFSRLMKRLDAKPPPPTEKRTLLLKRCLYLGVVCVLFSIVANIFEVYALLALQFCDGEDLMQLYWSSWTAMQFGAVIAILGTVLNVVHQLQGNNGPPWNLALGTPILIFTGVGHAVHVAARGPVKRLHSRSRSRKDSAVTVQDMNESGLPMSWQNTL